MLAALGVLIEDEHRGFGLTPVGYHLRSDADPSLQAWTAFVGQPSQWKAWTRLGDSVRTGENAFRLAHGMGSWDYRANHPTRAISSPGDGQSTSQSSAAIVAAYDFSRFRRVVDVGGGHGALVATSYAPMQRPGVCCSISHTSWLMHRSFWLRGVSTIDARSSAAASSMASRRRRRVHAQVRRARLGRRAVGPHPQGVPFCDGRRGRPLADGAADRSAESRRRRQALRPQHARRSGRLNGTHDRGVSTTFSSGVASD